MFLSMTLLQAVVFLLVDSQGPTAEPSAEETPQPTRFKNRGAALAIAIVILVVIVCCCCGCCYKKQIKERYQTYRYGGVIADGDQPPQYQQGNYPGGTIASAPMPVAQATINPGGGMGMVFGPDGKTF